MRGRGSASEIGMENIEEMRDELGDVEVRRDGEVGREVGGYCEKGLIALAERLEGRCLMSEGKAVNGILGKEERSVHVLSGVLRHPKVHIPSQPLLRHKQPPSCSVTIMSVYRLINSFCASSRQSQ